MRFLSAIFLLSTLNFSFSQENQKFINSFKLYSGFNNISVPKGFDIHIIDPNSQNFNLDVKINNAVVSNEKDDESFSNLWPYLNYYFNASIEHKLSNPKISWFFGLNIIKSKKDFYDFTENHTKSFETIYSNNQLIYSKDSVQNLAKYIRMDAKIISIENAFSFSTDENKRFSVYGGASTQIGITSTGYEYELKNDLLVEEVFHNDPIYDSGSDSYSPNKNTLSSVVNGYENTVYSTNGYFSLNAYFGTNISLSGKDKVNKKFYIFSEFKPGFAVIYVSKAKSFSNYYNGFYSWVGFRYKF